MTFESFGTWAAENGLDFHPIRGNAQALVAGGGANMLALVRSFGSLAEGYARDLSAPALGETDLLINQLPAGLYSFDLAEKYGLPVVQAAVMPLAPTRSFPLMGFPRVPLPGYNRATYVLGEQLAWQLFRGAINTWRKHTLALPPLPLAGYSTRLKGHPVPILNGYSRWVVPRPADWGEHVHICGSWFPADPAWQPSTDLQAFLGEGSPPVFIGFWQHAPQRTAPYDPTHPRSPPADRPARDLTCWVGRSGGPGAAGDCL